MSIPHYIYVVLKLEANANSELEWNFGVTLIAIKISLGFI